jgi:putative hemolysin
LLSRLFLWLALFTTAALLAGAETALTTLWPWKIKQLAADEGPNSPFADLREDLTGVLTSLLVAVTFCMVYSTALATEIAIQLFGKAGIGYATVALTLLTVVFGEVLPKCLAVANAERFARVTLPLISGVAFVLKPIGMLMSAVNKMVLRACGVETSGDTAVSQPERRLMIEGSKESGAVEDYEQDMIEGVLDLELTKVEQILVPRVDLVAVEGRTTLVGLLEVTKETKYSRIPVYNETVDEIIGIVLTRELLEYADKPGEELEKQSVESIMEETAFIPESMTAMNALKLMRKRRLHMLVVVDEFGGTSGVVTLEDILETMVGEIYDEDDFDEVVEDMEEIKLNADGSYTVDAGADLDLVCDRLELQLEDEVLGEFATIAGYLCSQAGQIPDTGDVILVSQGERRLRFEVLEADERRLKTVRARNMTTLDLERMARKVEPS